MVTGQSDGPRGWRHQWASQLMAVMVCSTSELPVVAMAARPTVGGAACTMCTALVRRSTACVFGTVSSSGRNSASVRRAADTFLLPFFHTGPYNGLKGRPNLCWAA